MTPNVTTELAEDGAWHITMQHGIDGMLTKETTQLLRRAFAEIPSGARFVLLQSRGPDFCAGRVSPTPQKGARVSYSDLRARVADPVLEFYEIQRAVPLPMIAVVRGRAYGVGCALAGLADLILADETARFAIPEMDRDIPPLLVMTALADRVARAHLARLVLTRESIGPEDAVQIGLASRACSSDTLDAAVSQARQALAANTPVITSTVKRFLNLAPELSFAQRREYAATANPGAMTERFLAD